MSEQVGPLTQAELDTVFARKYGEPESAGWSPALRHKFGCYHPCDFYEAMLARYVKPLTAWLDVGGGRNIFPNNQALAKVLAERCGKLVAIDPSPNLNDNVFTEEKYQTTLEAFQYSEKFDLVTMRMVVQHMEAPELDFRRLPALVNTGGVVIIYTTNRYSPVSLFTSLMPFRWHHKLRHLVWKSYFRDTFPTPYKLNTRKKLTAVFERNGFSEVYFKYLDDPTTFFRSKSLSYLELLIWKFLNSFGLRYPENNLLGVYRRL